MNIPNLFVAKTTLMQNLNALPDNSLLYKFTHTKTIKLFFFEITKF